MGNNCCSKRDKEPISMIYNGNQIKRILKQVNDIDNEHKYNGEFKHLFPLYRMDVDLFCLKLEHIKGDKMFKLETELVSI